MDELAAKTKTYIESLNRPDIQNKDAIQNVLLSRKLENLRKRYTTHRKIERKALSLIGKVNYNDILPSVAWVSPNDMALWRYYRDVLSSAPFDGRPGRCIYAFIVDKKSGGILGIFEIGSDMSVLGPRDRYIGWTHEDRFSHGMLRHVFNLGTCVPVQPFGWLTGGKMISLITTAQEISEIWKMRYGDILAAGVTTSLYGKSSQYERLKEWKYLGETAGSIGIAHIDKNGRKLIKAFCDTLPPQGKGRSASRSGAGGQLPSTLNDFINACNALGLNPSDYSASQPRGVYFAELGENSKNFLSRKNDKFLQNQESIAKKIDFWMNRWYSMRLPKKIEEIKAFDFSFYELKSQINYIENRLSADVGEMESRAATSG